jgi:hypothetical protein
LHHEDNNALDEGKEDVDVRDNEVLIKAGVVRDLGKAGAEHKVEGNLGKEEGDDDSDAAANVALVHEKDTPGHDDNHGDEEKNLGQVVGGASLDGDVDNDLAVGAVLKGVVVLPLNERNSCRNGCIDEKGKRTKKRRKKEERRKKKEERRKKKVPWISHSDILTSLPMVCHT